MSLSHEKRTIAIMVGMYCRHHHGSGDSLCRSCAELLDYALLRIDRCKFGTSKPVCAKCTIHCYKPSMRDEVRRVMRFAGPRMMLRHPLMALRHLVHSIFR